MTLDTLFSLKFWIYMGRLQIGLFLYGVAVSLMLEAHIGLDPWSAFHQSISVQSGLTFGRISQSVGFMIIIFSWLFSGGDAPAAPSPLSPGYGRDECTEDPTEDGIGCEVVSPTCN